VLRDRSSSPAAPKSEALVPAASKGLERAPGPVSFSAVTRSRGELLQSPVSGLPCVHWRLRIAEQVNPSLRLVHEVSSSEDFELAWAGRTPEASEVRIRVAAENADIHGAPILHAAGSPGALSIARQYGFAGALSVEEITLREGVEILAEGHFEELGEPGAGPFRGVAQELELLGAKVRLPARAVLAPVLLPWALGTAAAILGGVGAATWAAWRFDLVPRFTGVGPRGTVPSAEIGPKRVLRRHFSVPE
jgi:hypothetical protein